MDLKNRIELMAALGRMMTSDDPAWQEAKRRAHQHNAWFTPEFIDLAVNNIVHQYLQPEKLQAWASLNRVPDEREDPKQVGLVMAGNIPLVGFHDFLCLFISGHRQLIKLSSKDHELMSAVLRFVKAALPEDGQEIGEAALLKGCDAYIATGSDNTARYFDYYFGKYPSLIRRNRTSIAVLTGEETTEELEKLADDVHVYFGLGCRNVTQLLVPRDYDFLPLLNAFRKYHFLSDHHKYKNNYDYRLSLAILNKQFYMTNDTILLLESESPFSPISVLHYRFYDRQEDAVTANPESIQCIVGRSFIPFGRSQQPGLSDYADGADTMQFLQQLG